MESEIKKMLAKLSKLEKQINEISNRYDDFESSNFKVVTKNFLNFDCIDKCELEVSKIELKKQQSILIECIIELNSLANQEIEFGLKIGEIIISKIKTKVNIGVNKISFSKDYLSFDDNEKEICLIVNPVENKQIVLNSCTLNIWGSIKENRKTKYSFLETTDNYVLSFFKDDNLYYKIITKKNGQFNEIDFNFCAKAKDFEFAYDEKNDIVYLFRVDLDGNLFIDNLKINSSLFIEREVDLISAVGAEDRILISLLKNNNCFVFEMKDGFFVSKSKISYNYIINSCKVFYNKYSKLFYLILQTKNGKNLMLESSKNIKSIGDKLSANAYIDIELFEVKNES